MTASKNIYCIGKKYFWWWGGGGRSSCVAVPCSERFYLSCLQASDTECTFYMANYESPYKSVAYVKQLRSVRDENIPVLSLRSASTFVIGKKIVSADSQLIFPPLTDNVSLCPA
jgi:hypothetical protein